MKIPFTNLQAQYQDCKQDIDAAIQRCLDIDSFITGPDVTEFELKFAEYLGADDVASCGSGTTGLYCAMRALNIGPGDEVITVSHTFVATPESIVICGATPVFCDIDPDTWLVDLDQLETLINKNTRAVLFVDIYGQCPDIERVRSICNHYNLAMVEDAAQSVGNRWNGRPVGSLSDITCMSFNPVKNLGAVGDAGAVSGSKHYMNEVRKYRDHGRTGRYDIVEVGYNARIDNIQSNVVMAKLPKLDGWLERKREICNYYTEQLSSVIKTPVTVEGNSHSWYVYVIQTANRESLKAHLNDAGIGTNIHYMRAAHQQPAFAQWSRSLPVTERTVDEILSIPCWYSMTDSEVDYVVDNVKGWKS
jgi:dTDP-4-amino-4,6-dideoxygalactose transaminase